MTRHETRLPTLMKRTDGSTDPISCAKRRRMAAELLKANNRREEIMYDVDTDPTWKHISKKHTPAQKDNRRLEENDRHPLSLNCDYIRRAETLLLLEAQNVLKRKRHTYEKAKRSHEEAVYESLLWKLMKTAFFV
ncbi:hypothetical protein EVAR_91820_1 [Eumeta japonica]|uniref:Uncharacterized protein n=1 Tax=Eumeta variegata TaxID=151549 RepID=A0A4C1T8Z1_EUMVA|nr:hypothetical protein EVAR_91820_1 [Eumeta japonica]